MKQYRALFAFIAILVSASLACIVGTPEPTPVPPAPAPTEALSQPLPPAGGTSGTTTFVDQSKLFQIEVPADWTYEQVVDTENNNYYIDTFTSPDEKAVIESIVYDDGTVFKGSDTSRFALYLLNTFYSSTGKEGDIRVTEDSIQKDGSERLTWTSKGGGYSGISFLELRSNKTTFLFLTANWTNSAEDQYLDTINQVIASYSIP